MTKNSNPYGRIVPDDDPRDTRLDLKDTYVILDVRVRDGSKLTGCKEYVSREHWSMVDDETRAAIIAEVTAKLLGAVRKREQ